VTTVFTRIIQGEIPGTFIWRDDRCVGFMSINPMNFGHVLVVPIAEIDHWIDGDADLVAHLFEVSRVIAIAQKKVFSCARVGMIIAGYEVPHTHIHLVPTNDLSELSFARAAAHVEREELESAAEIIREELRRMGRSEVC
jgi:histidine triad (HIT) family protein